MSVLTGLQNEFGYKFRTCADLASSNFATQICFIVHLFYENTFSKWNAGYI